MGATAWFYLGGFDRSQTQTFSHRLEVAELIVHVPIPSTCCFLYLISYSKRHRLIDACLSIVNTRSGGSLPIQPGAPLMAHGTQLGVSDIQLREKEAQVNTVHRRFHSSTSVSTMKVPVISICRIPPISKKLIKTRTWEPLTAQGK